MFYTNNEGNHKYERHETSTDKHIHIFKPEFYTKELFQSSSAFSLYPCFSSSGDAVFSNGNSFQG
jgi:hypothetical protein